MQNLNPLIKNDFIIKSGSLPIFIFQMLTTETRFFISQLDKLFREKEFSQNTLIALDLQKLVDDIKVDFMLLKQTFALNNLTLFGIIGGTEQQRVFAVKCGLHLLPSSRKAINRKAKSEEPHKYLPTEVISNTVRSGQRIYAKNRDLICTATVNPGAEIIADGNIHIYGKLSGRALAGAGGDKEASIFCINCDAELIAIAGLYHADTNLRIPYNPRAIRRGEKQVEEYRKELEKFTKEKWTGRVQTYGG